MSFAPPPPPFGNGNSGSVSPNPVEDLDTNFQNLSVGNVNTAKSKKKRSHRAYHTEFNAPAVPDGASNGLTTPNQAQFPMNNVKAASPYTPATSQPQPFNASVSQFHTPAAAGTHSPYQDSSASYHNGPMDATEDLSLSNARYFHQLEYQTNINPENPSYKSFLTFQNIVPPCGGTQYHTIDQGTASSKFMRPTMYNVPENEQLRAATKLPVAVTVRPFAPLLPTEDPIPVVDMSQLGSNESSDPMDIGPPRCRRCRTYMNPSMQHTNHNTFICNICQFPNNTVPMDYTSMINPATGQRIDRDIKPELHRGVYDIMVPKEYNVGGASAENKELHHVFLLDVSENSVKHSLPVLVADAIRATLYNFEDSDSPSRKFEGKFALIAFDKRLHFYNLSPSLDSTQISISADLEDPFVPFNEGLFVDPEESRLAIEDALNNLESLTSQETLAESEPCFAAACRYATMCLESVGGGKITSILSALPSWGPGGLKFKDNRAIGRGPSPEVEKRVFLPDNEYYKSLAKDFLSKNVGLDVLVVCNLAVDLSNIGWLANVSGGSVYKYSDFEFERDGRNFTSKFVNCVNKTTGYQGQLKLRCSNGLQVAQYYGTSSSISELSVIGGTVQDPVLPILNEDQTFTVLLQYDGDLNTKYDCHFQAALLYTDQQGIRKVRVVNLVLAVSERLEDVFNFVDQDSVITTMVRDTLSFVGKQPLSELRDSINEKLVEVFSQYRAMSEIGHNRNRALNKQLIFPESLKHLPLYLLGFIKHLSIREASGIPADTRLNEIFQILTEPIDRIVYKLYPALVELHSLAEDDCLIPQTPENIHGFVKIPLFKELTTNNLQFGVYILCNGDDVYVWIHQNANILLIKDLFGEEIEEVKEINPLLDELPELPTDISQQARNLVNHFQTHIIGASPIGAGSIKIIREGIDRSEILFKELLVEDALKGAVTVSGGPSYPDYLSSLHKAIRVKLENEKQVRDSISSAEHHNDTLAQRLIHF
ncbi:beta-sandwich domain of Sec23/24 [Hyphopichia burtonii NRRL Y-1933]|uniref:Beta-sandwich domain of Sec23/24 n=1 Tax=Hyphopichia burtonii NRRL Y-1933 TaxID=984485 RepID=A0A1E4RF05_9ASCO|nr:beta-sandwich domain of Sec23/24 [Hyphopichia burtonii NRRL Y-1933]ODV65820.1 beta-sandwich domain of Sec23/24 [Hyphopichia burtonii NRRL Y-1933]